MAKKTFGASRPWPRFKVEIFLPPFIDSEREVCIRIYNVTKKDVKKIWTNINIREAVSQYGNPNIPDSMIKDIRKKIMLDKGYMRWRIGDPNKTGRIDIPANDSVILNIAKTDQANNSVILAGCRRESFQPNSALFLYHKWGIGNRFHSINGSESDIFTAESFSPTSC